MNNRLSKKNTKKSSKKNLSKNSGKIKLGKKKQGSKALKKKQSGGWDPNYHAGGMDWNYGWGFVEDIVGTVMWGVASLVNGVETVVDLVNIKSDMGTAFHAKNAPSPDTISVPKL